MKQEIIRCSDNGSIKRIFNCNNSGQKHGLFVGYWFDGSLWGITNWVNGKRFGFDTYKPYSSDEIKQKYHL